MRISICTRTGRWVEALSAALPQATIEGWSPGAPQADYAVVWSPPQQFLDEQWRLKALFNLGAGVDALMVRRLRPETMVVRLEDGGMAVQMAEFVCHALIRHFRELDVYQAEVRQGMWSDRRPRSRAEMPVGIMGLGVLGERVARAVAQFDFPVRGWSRTPHSVPGVRCYSGQAEFVEFLAASRVLVCLLPLTAETENIMDRQTLERLLPGGYVINVARGAHLVDDDLIALLDSGHLAGAALDVFRVEPLPAEHPFWRHPKITLTPHTSARTLRDESVAQIAGKILALERGEPIGGVVDAKRRY
jgi:glyoxylate/hydroxypyruvate reductase